MSAITFRRGNLQAFHRTFSTGATLAEPKCFHAEPLRPAFMSAGQPLDAAEGGNLRPKAAFLRDRHTEVPFLEPVVPKNRATMAANWRKKERRDHGLEREPDPEGCVQKALSSIPSNAPRICPTHDDLGRSSDAEFVL